MTLKEVEEALGPIIERLDAADGLSDGELIDEWDDEVLHTLMNLGTEMSRMAQEIYERSS